ncbi:peptidoglycan-binding protein [Novosphingobium profundi]|uniref:peptidoglycan-binding protein n=1 Tax=Novosphingobium profundi TaxID=1774954 RepID=UPI001FED15B9|nr:peptidoglycan-binding protein [Novosphingobium profundi]
MSGASPLSAGASGASGAMTPAQRAHVIYTEARAQMSERLWRAALGGGDESETGKPGDPFGRPKGLDSLLNLLQDGKGAPASADPRADAFSRLFGASPALPVLDQARMGCASGLGPEWSQSSGGGGRGTANSDAQEGSADQGGQGDVELQGGPNARYAPMLREAASRTGLPAAALATIVHAEAARGSDGRWLAYSRNPRSSAAGLGQFLNATWISEAERAGTWLNAQARERGWLDARGRVERGERGALLALRYDPQASIETTADFARANLDAFRRAGIQTGGSVEDVARTAYLGHHLGRGDAIRFLTGNLNPERARNLLDAQIGSVAAARRVALAGSAVVAHRDWLMGYVDRTIQPARFGA